ncbi:alcohol oxidase [Aureobasidium namibiae CBS 147.97]|uniref:Alcohol oxidase n=1 Tax=Aureobasidium namibiae CBS 147.97 TaxID=1043004 RepID=A0A074W666_9PEZI|nr:alcohol oxidase [Aureobasidium namibiae CBS 147.97]KEQ68378.1 alcohol oxidase [Aureobasidium namibiae CBS 147.97]
MVNGLIDWRFPTTPQSSLLNRTIHYVRGRCLGGSSARNYMVYNRGVYPYYRKSPHYTPANTHLRATNTSVGTVNESPSFARSGGPLQVSYPNFAQPWASFYPSAFEEIGIPSLSQGVNAGVLDGYASITLTQDPIDKFRSSSDASFLQKALASTDLVVYTHTMSKRILFDANKTAIGVSVEVNGVQFQINATREVILSAGAFLSPQMLMASGVGQREILDHHNIPVVADRPGVGQNMWVALAYESNVETPSVLQNDPTRISQENEEFLTHKSGLLTSNGGSDIVGFLKLSNQSVTNLSSETVNDFQANFPQDWPEIQVLSYAIGPNDGINQYAGSAIGLLATFSRGNVTINSADMSDAPIINPAYLTDKRDQELGVAAFRFARRLAATESLQRAIIGDEVVPGPGVATDAEILRSLQQSITPFYHASCTCKMGKRNDSMAVVDSEARAIGVSGLRVVDVSAFALLPPGQPQATVYMLAEKIADMILGHA